MLLSLCDTLEEVRGIAGVIKEKPSKTVFKFERMEEGTILVVLEVNV